LIQFEVWPWQKTIILYPICSTFLVLFGDSFMYILKNVVVFLLLPVYLFAGDTTTTTLYQTIAKENLKSLTTIQVDKKPDVLSSLINDEKEFYDILYDKQQEQLNPSEHVKRMAIFNLLCQQNVISSEVLDEKTWQDLEILCGPKSDPTFYLASKIDRTCTQAGKATLYSKIVNPSCDIEQLEHQQRIVRELVENPKLFDQLDKQLKDLVIPENAMLSFWAEDIFLSLLQHHKIKVPLFKKLEAWLNKNEMALDVSDKFEIAREAIVSLMMAVAAITLPLYVISRFADPNSKWSNWLKDKNTSLGISKIGMFFTAPGFVCGLLSFVWKNRWTAGGSDVVSGLVSGHQAWRMGWGGIKDTIAIRTCIQERLIYVATYLNNVKSMLANVKSNPVLRSRMPAIETCDAKLVSFAQTSADAQHLLDLLETETFKGEASVLSYTGRVYAAFKLMHILKEQFVDAMAAVGELDAQLSIAKLYKEFSGKRVMFCFPTYIDSMAVDAPSVSATDFWNPFINPEKVVPSSLRVGLPYGVPQNVIITGPNAGGKSTITKAFVIAVILSQGLGIAPAKELTLTPFTKIITYLNITDDIAAGNSHFKAGVLRAQDVEKAYGTCKEHEYVLTAIDEVFNGTTFKEGQAAAYSLIKILGMNPLGMCITNTHFPIIPTLEKSIGRFMNYKVTVIEKPGEKIQYPFKLEPGISDQVVTLKILKEEGFGDAFIDQAQQVLDGCVGAF
jgi:DNA mismatch repair protein MutS